MKSFSLVVFPPQNEKYGVEELYELWEPEEVNGWGDPHGPWALCGIDRFADPVVVADGVDQKLVSDVKVNRHHGKVVPADNGVDVKNFSLEMTQDLLCWVCLNR